MTYRPEVRRCLPGDCLLVVLQSLFHYFRDFVHVVASTHDLVLVGNKIIKGVIKLENVAHNLWLFLRESCDFDSRGRVVIPSLDR